MTTLEDFFTLTEMKDGLSDIARVEELLRLVQDVNDGFVNNLGDSIRQWSTVANILVATQNNECLDHFVQLDGLCFLNNWLQEAIDCNADDSQNNVKELIDTLLMSLERLPIHNEKLTASGIAINIQRLLDHENVKIMKAASLLCDKWNLVTENVTTCLELQQGGASQGDKPGCPIEEKETEDGLPAANPIEISSAKEKNSKVQSSENENVTARCHHSESSHLSSSTKEDVQVSDRTLPSASLNSDSPIPVLGDTNSSVASLVPNSVQNLSSVIDGNSVCTEAGFASANASVIEGERDRVVESQCHTVSHDVSDSVKEMNMDLVANKFLYHSVPNDAVDNSLSSVSEKSLAGIVQPVAPCNFDSKVTESSSAKVVEPQTESEAIDTATTDCCTIMESKPITKANKSSQEQGTLTNTYSSSKPPQFSCESDVSDQFRNLLKSPNWEMGFMVKKGNAIMGDSSMKSNGDNAAKEIDHKSELGFMCVDDALEVARQVAIQVEREVVDYREGFCSSPEVNFGEHAGANSSDSEEAVKQDNELTEEAGEHSSLPEKDDSLDSSSGKEGSEVTHNVSSDLENLDQDLQSQKLDAPAQESVGNSETDRCGLDLNADIVNEEHECVNPVNVSVPVAIVAPSRGSPVLPVTLQFEGGMGWKGTAATSAFRPASPRRTSESDKTISISKKKRAFLDIDLNVAESEDEVVGQLSVKQVPSSLPSGDSLTEVSSQRAGKLKFDLNRLVDEDASTYPTSHFKIHQNGDQSLSSASSSSSKHPSVRDFDLNDNPSFLNVGASHNFDKSTKTSDAYGASNLNDPAITILGSRMTVERRDFGNQVQQLFPTNGFNMEYSAVAGQSMPYAHMPPPVYGFAGIPTGPNLPAPRAFYSPGSFPYIDPRGQPVMPQSTVVSGYNGQAPNRPPFFMNVPAATSNSVAYGSARPGFDINAGMTLFDTGAKGANFKHFLFQGQNNLEDQTKAIPQSSSSVLPSKRKEPDSGWESYPYGYRQMT